MIKLKTLLSAGLLFAVSSSFAGSNTPIDLKNFELVESPSSAKVVPVATIYKYKAGDTLDKVMHLWALQKGWSAFEWRFPADFPEIEFQEDWNSDITIASEGSLEKAYMKVLKSLQIDNKVQVTFHRGNNYVVVTPKP